MANLGTTISRPSIIIQGSKFFSLRRRYDSFKSQCDFFDPAVLVRYCSDHLKKLLKSTVRKEN